MVEELSPENAWQKTARFNPDSEAGAWKRLKTWTRGMVPASILQAHTLEASFRQTGKIFV